MDPTATFDISSSAILGDWLVMKLTSVYVTRKTEGQRRRAFHANEKDNHEISAGMTLEPVIETEFRIAFCLKEETDQPKPADTLTLDELRDLVLVPLAAVAEQTVQA